MNLNKKKVLTVAAFGVTCAFALSGCEVVDMTDSQEKIIAEYAADVLIHYDASYYDMFAEEPRIVDNMQESSESDDESAISETQTPQSSAVASVQTPEVTASPEPDNTQEEVTGEPVTANVAQQSISPLDVGKMFGLDKVEISYKDLKIVDKYPDVSENEMAFQMSASENHKLMVLTFDVLNTADLAVNCNILGQNVKFRVCVNDKDYLSVQKTLLSDDLSQMNVTIQPHENKTAVVVCQVPSDYNPEISSLSLVVRIGGEDKTVKLK